MRERVKKSFESWVRYGLAGCMMAGLAVAAGAQQPSGALVVSGPPPDLFLLYTGDVIGYLDPCG